jgi:hypothetical protein
MRSRYLKLAIYTVLLAAVATGALALAWLRGGSFPSWWVILFGIGASLFVWQFGLRAPRLAARQPPLQPGIAHGRRVAGRA